MSIPFNLKHPNQTWKLARPFAEISGIWHLPERGSLAFVQDEALAVYELALDNGTITDHPPFVSADAEDLVIQGDTAFVLVAGLNPAIYSLDRYTDPGTTVRRYELGLHAAHDPEGLTLDPETGHLLIACKGSRTKSDPKRKVFAMDPVTNHRFKKPRLVIDSREFLDAKKEIFHPAGIAIHPNSGDIYLVGTRGAKMLLRYNRDGHLLDAIRLKKKLFRQPEGIAFNAEGEMFICSEAKSGKKARIHRFSPYPWNSD